MGKKLTNIEFYIGVLAFFAILVGGLSYLGLDIASNSNANLDNDSNEYIGNLSGVDVSAYTASKERLESSNLISGNESAGNPKDESLDFLYAKEKGVDIELIIKRIFNVPSFILIDLLRLPLNDWKWVLNIITWLLWISVAVALIYFARNR